MCEEPHVLGEKHSEAIPERPDDEGFFLRDGLLVPTFQG